MVGKELDKLWLTRRAFVRRSSEMGMLIGLLGVTGFAAGCAAGNPEGSSSANSSALASGDYDVIVIGAGVTGCCTARELSRYKARVLVLEAGLDLACGATRANSGIVHAGYDPKPGTAKAHYNVTGAALYPQWASELGFAYIPNGALVIALSQEERATLEDLADRARQNGVAGVEIIDGSQAREAEPSLSADVVAALNVPGSAICDPYGITYGAAENAADNGVEFGFGCKVVNVEAIEAGYLVTLDDGSAIRARAVVNAAGVHSDEVNNMVSASKLTITPRRGEYALYEHGATAPFSHTIFQTPTQKGKGVLVSPVAFGNVFIGPNAVDQEDKEDRSTTAEGIAEIVEQAKRTWTGASLDGVIATYAGLRARDASGAGDFVLGQPQDAPGFFNVACIDSPGLASAPAIATDTAKWVAEYLGASENPDFNPNRSAPLLMALVGDDVKAQAIARDSSFGMMVCRCSNVTRGELVDAMHRALPVLTIDALKWRTGATMGPCHGGYCMAHIVDLMVHELGYLPYEVAMTRQKGSYVVSDAEVPEDAKANMAHDASAGDTTSVASADLQQREVDVVVVGGGIAGMHAAALLASDEKARVAVVEQGAFPGGLLYECASALAPADLPESMKAGLDAVAAAKAKLEDGAAELFDHTTAMRIDLSAGDGAAARHTVTCLGPAGVTAFAARAVVIATGTHVRGTGTLAMTGTRPAGVTSAYAAQRLCELTGYLPGKKGVVVGSDALVDTAAILLSGAGMDVEVRGDIEAFSGDSAVPDVVISGSPRVSEIKLPSDEVIEADALIVGLPCAPNAGLAERAGIYLEGEGSTQVAGVFACGAVAGNIDSAEAAAESGKSVASAVAAYLQS